MPSTAELKRGIRIELDGDPYVVVDVNQHSPTARGGNTLVRVKVRNLRNNQLLDKTFKAGERLKEPDFELRAAAYLYGDGDNGHVFMDNESYEQFTLAAEQIEDAIPYLKANAEVRALVFNSQCIGIELPHTVVLTISETQPGSRADTVTAATKGATLETGAPIQVPLFVNAGDQIVVDTREHRYVRRA